MIALFIRWVIILLALVNAAFMTYDGSRALIKGDYVRPASGSYAGQLGPWSKLVNKMGINPMSTGMKLVFVIYGLSGLVITIAFALKQSWATQALLIYNICCLWNLFFGTASSVLQIILLMVTGGNT